MPKVDLDTLVTKRVEAATYTDTVYDIAAFDSVKDVGKYYCAVLCSSEATWASKLTVYAIGT